MFLAQAQSPFGALGGFLPFILILVIFYLLLILPQQRRQKQHRAMLAALKAGDKVITSGGVFGTITGIDDESVILRVADQVKIKVLRSAITQVEKEGEAK
jgi:preprotein translocase subunit YajC